MAKMFRDIDELTVKGFLSSMYRIPHYQRPYSWKRENIEDLVADIRRLEEDETGTSTHYLGSTLVVSRSGNVRSEIVDGQQRTTTLLLSLLVLLTRLEKIAASGTGGSAVAGTRADSVRRYIVGHLGDEEDETPVLRIELCEQDEGEWQRLWKDRTVKESSSDFDSNSELLLNDAYATLTELLLDDIAGDDEEVERLWGRAKTILNRLYILVLGIDTNKDVFKVFLTINDRGKPLSTGDLLRTTLLSIAHETDPKKLYPQVDRTLAPLLKHDDETVTTLLTHFVNSFTGKRVSKKQVLPELLGYLTDSSDEARIDTAHFGVFAKALGYLMQIHQKEAAWFGAAYPFKGATVESQERHQITLDVMGAKSCIPLLVAGMLNLKKERFAELVRATETVVIRAFVTNSVHKSALADFFIRQAAAISASKAWDDTGFWKDAAGSPTKSESKRLDLQVVASDEVFGAAIAELSYMRPAHKKLIKNVLLSIEHWNTAKERFEADRPVLWKALNVDHIIAQAQSSHPVMKSAELGHSLGNLCLLQHAQNKGLGKKKFAEKKKLYLKSSFEKTRALGKPGLKDWSEASAKARLKLLVQLSLSMWALPSTS
jgi:hypothetical protein